MIELAQQYFDVVYETGDGWRACCPFCMSRGENRNDTKHRLNYFNDSGMVWCFNCQYRATLAEALSRHSGKPFKGILQTISGALDPHMAQSPTLKQENLSGARETYFIKSLKLTEKGEKFLKARGISRIRAKQFGIVDDGNDIYFPFYAMTGEMNFWQARNMKNKIFRQPSRSTGYKSKGFHLYNIWAAKLFRDWVMAEANLSCATIGLRAIGSMGCTLSKHQLAFILHYRPRSLTIMPDIDKWGTFRADLADEIQACRDAKIQVYAAHCPSDPNAVGPLNCRELLHKRLAI